MDSSATPSESANWPGRCAASCDAITPAGLVAASRLDPLGTPPADVALALAVPDALRLSNGDATLRPAFVVERASAPAVDVTVPLDVA
ncbi:hypothetical protein [Jannaschia seohaensis]|uniref:Uncharacterized protein n=1 Tax=Jannaschia seohaensis TaxID=475081 RepID=A0A2Y9AMD1_9RHOB|nr:hypothetical protein [Jannaschia seohaensis]PWJ19075.1 hypothetical protein BCF38_1043 [Jannaschia seohaensis]SSA45684.1 hypothetical protein SAMN05421539_1043 [Jannaschia seohaensis]